MTTATPFSFVPLSRTLPYWPSDLFGEPEFLDEIGLRDFEVQETADSLSTTGTLLWFRELSLDLPGLDGLSFALLSADGYTAVPFDVDILPSFKLTLPKLTASLRVRSELLRPVRLKDGAWVPTVDAAGTPVPAEIRFDGVGFEVDGDGDVAVTMPAGAPQISFGPVQLGETGLVLDVHGVTPFLSRKQTPPAGASAGFRGVALQSAKLYLPPDLDVPLAPTSIQFEHLLIGTGGFGGKITGAWNPVYNSGSRSYSDDGAGTLFGVPFGLRKLSLEFVQNVPAESELRGELALPFFEQPVGVDLGLAVDGSFHVALSSVQPAGVTNTSGLVKLTKPGVLDLTLDSIAFEEKDGVFLTKISGKLKPLVGSFEWPEFDVKELSIDSEGHVKLEGGWLDLPSQYALDFHGFKLEITKLGFGKTEDGGKWIGFSGGLKLVEGMPAGASVEGLRVIWYPDGSTDMTLNGVGVEFAVPNVLKFKGEVSHVKSDNKFTGDITLKLISLDLEIDAKLVFGKKTQADGTECTFFAIYLGVELPAGIPLFSTGLALYGMAGLFARQMHPDKTPEEEWYEGWYKRADVGVVDLDNKWDPQRGSLALGAGVTVGTISDNGYTFSGRVLFVIVFPGPILLLEGMANLLKPRAALSAQSAEPTFRALAVLDKPAGTFTVGLDAKYKYDAADGKLIDVRGGAEAFFDLDDPHHWHLYLGEDDPREKRIRAQIFKLFEANAYLMIDPNELATGAWVGYDKHWKFGPLKVDLEAWIEGNAVISFKPAHLHGDLWLHGSAGLHAFKFGITLTIDAKFEAEVFDPFHVKAEFSVAIDLPKPLKDLSVDITLEWGPQKIAPPLPLPLKEIAVEHFKSTTKWPLARGQLLLPDLDDGNGFIGSLSDDTEPEPAVTTPVPVVPLDARPHITFGRTVHDDALIGVNPQAVTPIWEQIGDPKKHVGPAIVRYGLKCVALEKKTGSTWEPVARKAEDANAEGVETLFGSWAITPQLPSGTGASAGQTKLWLWSKSGFEYARNTSGQWNDWVTQDFPTYPCIPKAVDRTVCWDFEKVPPSAPLPSPWSHPAEPKLRFVFLSAAPTRAVVELATPVARLKHALCVPPKTGWTQLRIELPEPSTKVELTVFKPVGPPARSSIDFRKYTTPQTGPNPLTVDKVTFEARGSGGAVVLGEPPIVQQLMATPLALTWRSQLWVSLPCASGRVEVTLGHIKSRATIFGLNAAGDVVAAQGVDLGPTAIWPGDVVKLTAPGITRLVIVGDAVGSGYNFGLYQLSYDCPGTVPETYIEAYAVNARTGQKRGPVQPRGNTLTLTAKNTGAVIVQSKAAICVAKICVTVAADADDVKHRSELADHQQKAIATWAQTGEVLEPDTDYRLRVVTTVKSDKFEYDNAFNTERELTQFAYFRTEGPPGLTSLTRPEGATTNFDSGLEDLQRYVRQTIPPTVPEEGVPPRLPRPVFRAYDVGAEFDVDYVDLMYRSAGRDLGLYLYDNNNRPVRDAEGRLIVLANSWGETETLALSATDTQWLATISGSGCLTIDMSSIPKNRTLEAPNQVLDGDTVYEARLVPLLMHEAFAKSKVGDSASGPSGTLGRWTVYDAGTTGGPSKWEIGETTSPAARFVTQTSGIKDASTSAAEPLKAGAILLAGNTAWDDYRLSAYLRSGTDGALGLVFRYADPNNHYRFSIDRAGGYRRLVRLQGGAATVLAEDDVVHRQATDYLFTIEAVGSSLRVYQDGELVFDVEDSALATGRIGLYAWDNTAARFSDVRVDDFRPKAPVVYRFKFTTSRFAHFFHLLHSFDDERWLAALPAGDVAQVATLAQAAVVPATAPSDAEARAYASLAQLAVHEAALQDAPSIEVTRLESATQALGLLVRSPEPIDWARTSLAVSRAAPWTIHSSPPHTLKLTDVAFSSGAANDESVSVLLRDAADLTGTRIELKRMPGPLRELVGDPVLLDESFDGEPRGVVFRETFGPNALDHYDVVDQGTTSAPSAWTSDATQILQKSKIYGGDVAPATPDKPGTVALLRAGPWSDVRVRVLLGSTDGNAIGVVFRYRDASNYYRFSMDRARSYRRLVKCVGGTFTTLWEDTVAYATNKNYDVLLEAGGPRLVGYVNGELIFTVEDGAVDSGRVGLYSWQDAGVRFVWLELETLERSPLLWRPALTDLSELEIVDGAGATGGPSAWSAAAGVLRQTSSIGTFPDRRGTYAVGGSADWEDVSISLSLDADFATNGAVGVLFRYVDADNYYLFSFTRLANFFTRSLRRRVNGVLSNISQQTQTWGISGAWPYKNRLTITAVGGYINGFLGDTRIFTAANSTFGHGRVGLFADAETNAQFKQLVVHEAGRSVGRWRVHDDDNPNAPATWAAAWAARAGQLRQILEPGHWGMRTQVVRGDPDWDDYRLTVQLRPDDTSGFGVVFRYVDDRNYYRLSFDHQTSQRLLVKRTNGVTTTLWPGAGGYAVGVPISLTVEAAGNRLTGWLGDTQLFDVTDADHPQGRVGVYSPFGNAVRFESVTVTRLPVEASALFRDQFAASSTAGWTFDDPGTTSGPSAWAAGPGGLVQTSGIYTPPDDRNTLPKQGTNALAGDPDWEDVILQVRLRGTGGTLGVLFRYGGLNAFYRFSMDHDRSYRRLVKHEGAFIRLWEDSVPYVVGRDYELTIVAIGGLLRGYLDGVPLFTVENSDLPSGRIGLYAWKHAGAVFSDVRVYPTSAAFGQWLLDEPFDALVPGRWTFVDHGTQAGPSVWTVANGVLTQTSGIHDGGPPSAKAKLGTSALTGDADLRDYRWSVRMSSADAGVTGVYVRYVDAFNWYRISIDRQGGYPVLEVVKNVGGTYTVLVGQFIVDFPLGEYILTVDCDGPRLTGYLNAERLFDVTDADLPVGRVGLYSYRAAAPQFSEARLSGPVWTPIYRFGDERRLPAGTRLRVFSGNATAAPAVEPNVLHRFAATFADAGRRFFAGIRPTLRLVRPDGAVEHERSFAPASAYAATSVVVLREADGTELFVLPQTGALTPGDYRLALTYRRDNTAAEPKSLIFKQAGDTGSEVVRIDVPWGG